MQSSVQPEAFFLAAEAGFIGQRFCLFHPPQGPVRGQVLYVHPFAEEMNKSRRMAALQSRALARSGLAVLQIDLFGCGDSSGNFGDASWSGWIDDIARAAGWLAKRAAAPLWLWGLRAGCLLAAGAARHIDGPCNFLFWQPPAAGKALLQQFLRLKVAAEMLSGTSAGAMGALRGQLAAGASIDVAGYTLSSAMAAELERASLLPPSTPQRADRLQWFELSSRAEAAPLAPASLQAVDAWRGAGCSVHSQVVPGPAFWQTAEIEEAPSLLAATLAALDSAEP
jgi:exosortase A-associated hydrolase 2